MGCSSSSESVEFAVCQGRSCRNAGSEALCSEIEELARGLGPYSLRGSRCLGACGSGPNAIVVAEGSRSVHMRLKSVEARAEFVQKAFGKAPDPMVVKSLADARQTSEGKVSQQIHTYAAWRLNSVTPVSKHSAMFCFSSEDKKRGTPNLQGRSEDIEPKTWHFTLLVPVGESIAQPNLVSFFADPSQWVERNYTPISSAKDWENGKCCLLIKIYAGGLATSWIAQQPVGCTIWFSQPLKTLAFPGLFPSGRDFRPASVLLLLAGTGIVTAAQILQLRDPFQNIGFSIPSPDKLRVPIDLIYSCRKDDALMVADMIRWCRDSRLGLRHCSLLLTEPNLAATRTYPNAQEQVSVLAELDSLPNAELLQGRLSQELLASAISKMTPHEYKIVVSGPAEFNTVVNDMLFKCGVGHDAITILEA